MRLGAEPTTLWLGREDSTRFRLPPMLAAVGTWGVWAVLTAVGTVGAVMVAVGLQAWLDWKQRTSRPELTLHFDAHMKTQETNPATGAQMDYLRLAVSNAEGKDTAEDVEVLVVEIQELATSPAGSGGRRVWLANPALGWANSLDPLPRMTIPPGTTRYVDVGRWLQLESPVAELSFVLSVVPEPGSNRHILTPGRWRIRLAATIRNGDATFWDAEISYEETTAVGLVHLVGADATVMKIASATA